MDNSSPEKQNLVPPLVKREKNICLCLLHDRTYKFFDDFTLENPLLTQKVYGKSV